jgi:GT2 family glycosyltransferase
MTLFDTLSAGLQDELADAAPAAVRVIELDGDLGQQRLPPSRDGDPYRHLLALARRGEQPLGWLSVPVARDGTVSLDALADASVLTSAAAAVNGHLQPHTGGIPEPLMSVVVTTCANSDLVLACIDSICSQRSGPTEIIVVENRPSSSTVERDLGRRPDRDVRIEYVAEPGRGLSRARNAGLRAARGELVVFTDDDILIDRTWMRAIRAAFVEIPTADCVTGPILPLELETPAQILVERFASFGKGFVRRVYSIDEPPPDQPLFPFSAGYFGSGANMAFRTEVIRRMGGFDTRLGAGTVARAGEDLDICIRLLASGKRLVYEPGAIVWHRHPDTYERLRRQVFGYGVGLGAMLSKQVIVGPHRLALLARAPRGIAYFRDPGSRKNASRGPSFPRSLKRLEHAGVLLGPLAYLLSHVRSRG